jgi:menaquinone-specific isochorismate synthase
VRVYLDNAPQNIHLQVRSFNGDLYFSGKPERIPLPSPTAAKIVRRTTLPDKKRWLEMVQEAKALSLPKIVLARRILLELDHAPDPFALTAALPTEGAHRFCLSTPESAFFGASPERLFSRHGDTLYTEAVAGTRKRGTTPEEDALLAKELLQSLKDQAEFLPVKQYLASTLTPFCHLQFSPTRIHKTHNVQHLYAQGHGTVIATDTTLLQTLHPTPALCGLPKEKARAAIAAIEKYDRGLYGGVLSWNTHDQSEHIVLIRSCHLQGNLATLFVGAGIVPDSDGDAEWEETEQKAKLYDRIFLPL